MKEMPWRARLHQKAWKTRLWKIKKVATYSQVKNTLKEVGLSSSKSRIKKRLCKHRGLTS